MAWAPLIVAVSRRGNDLLPGIRAQLDDLGFATVVGSGFESDDQSLIDGICRQLRPPRIAMLFELPSSFTPGSFKVDREASAGIPVLYVWPDLRGSWSPLLVGVSPFGRKAVFALASHLAGAGFPVFVSSVSADDSEAIIARSRLIAPPAGAGFVDVAPDGAINPDIVGLASPLN